MAKETLASAYYKRKNFFIDTLKDSDDAELLLAVWRLMIEEIIYECEYDSEKVTMKQLMVKRLLREQEKEN